MCKKVLDELRTILNEDDTEAVIEHRNVTIKKPLTVRAARNLVKEFAKIEDKTAAVDLMIDKCWRGFKADWYFNEVGSSARRAGRMGSNGTQLMFEKYQRMSQQPERPSLKLIN